MRTTSALRVAAVAIALCASGCTRQPPTALHVHFNCKFGDGDLALPISVNLGKMNGIIATAPDVFIRMHLSSTDNQLVLSFDEQSDAPPKVWIRPDGGATLRENWTVPGQIGELKGTCEREDA